MDVVDRDLLREAFGDDGDRPTLDHRALQDRGRRRRVSRRLTGSLVTVAAIAVVGAVAVTSQQGPRTLVVEPLAGPPPEEAVEDTDVVRGLADEMWFEIRAASDVTDEADPECHVWVDYGTDLHGRVGGVMVCGEVHDDRIELQTLTVGVETGAATIDSLDAETTLVLGLVDESITEVRASFSDGEVRRIATTDLRGLPDAPPFRVVVLAVQGPVSVTNVSARLSLEGADDQLRVDPDLVGRPTDDRWVTRDEMRASQGVRGQSTWVVGYFYPSEAAMSGPDFSGGLEPRWLRISDGPLDLDRGSRLREALAVLVGPPPTDMTSAWQHPGIELTLGVAELDGTELILDFDRLAAPANGSSHAMAMRAQLEAVAFDHFPEASSICALEDGQPTIWLHDGLSCPSRA